MLPVPTHTCHPDLLERRQRAAVQDSGEGGAAGVGDPGAASCGYDGAPCELRQPSTPPDQEDAAA
eukprot:scaffold31252_cov63-Phaeocystis_antarctica.AAC.5